MIMSSQGNQSSSSKPRPNYVGVGSMNFVSPLRSILSHGKLYVCMYVCRHAQGLSGVQGVHRTSMCTSLWGLHGVRAGGIGRSGWGLLMYKIWSSPDHLDPLINGPQILPLEMGAQSI
eukprot:TRINITY_DN14984_c1_g1_i1.p1 TRINITY_DN14984_c1_g1~~TRINITY_DN14984_c1_g1_i1.p1  ORF type:complete len:118 (+),score=5.43 TRINITY_DN14984_c1_g1_i1:1045-1398(+)